MAAGYCMTSMLHCSFLLQLSVPNITPTGPEPDHSSEALPPLKAYTRSDKIKEDTCHSYTQACTNMMHVAMLAPWADVGQQVSLYLMGLRRQGIAY